MKLLLIALCLVSGQAFSKGSPSCDNVYDSNGDIAERADLACNGKVRFYVLNKKGSRSEFTINDPLVEDAHMLKSAVGTIHIITHRRILQVTAHVQENTIYDFQSMKELKDRSWNDLDFANRLANNVLIDGVLYGNGYDSGNFLWGFAAAKLGTPLVTARIGAHYNSLTSKEYQKEWQGQLDSEGDQKAISHGHAYFHKTATEKQKKLKYLDYVIP